MKINYATQRNIALLLGFLFFPLFVGVMVALSTFSKTLIHKEPAPLEFTQQKKNKGSKSSNLPKVALLLDHKGVQISDVLYPYALLQESKAFEVYTVAQTKALIPTTGALAIYPDFDFKSLPAVDYWVIPALLDPTQLDLVQFAKERFPKAKGILAVCEGSRLLAHSGILRGKKATSHFMSNEAVKKTYPQVFWDFDHRWVKEKNWISTAGVTGSIDGTLEFIRTFASPKDAKRVEDNMALSQVSNETRTKEPLSFQDLFYIMTQAAFQWNKRGVLLEIHPGADEFFLATTLDLIPRSFNSQIVTVGATRKIYETKRGLKIVPVIDSHYEVDADVRIQIPSTEKDLIHFPIPLEVQQDIDWSQKKSGTAIPTVLNQLAEWDGNESASWVAKLIEFPWNVDKKTSNQNRNTVWIVWFLLGMTGAGLVWLFDWRIRVGREAKKNAK
ncbi:MAG: hypothetical protein CL678_10005 [Bdellovibrionaceae bacterium]|nr:hypothetical protein [Pseudobdellovibrionaceae bacterium]|tara:strand:+ start:125 stop:1456 length:1332 start_codon:yes stop_codon:yes gene_type:complete